MKLVKGRTLAALLSERERPARRPAAVPGDLRAGLPDDGLRPRPGRDPPRPEAVERDGGQLRRGAGDGLGAGQGARTRGASPTSSEAQPPPVEESVIRTVRSGSAERRVAGRQRAGDAGLHGARAGRGRDRAGRRRADVFGLGSILCEILTGQPAYTGRSADEMLRKAMRGRHGRRAGPARTPARPTPS